MRKTFLSIFVFMLLCSPAFSKVYTLCEFPWDTSYLGLGERVQITLDVQSFDVEDYHVPASAPPYQPTMRPNGGINFAVNYGRFANQEEAESVKDLIKKVSFKNITRGENYESSEVFTYKFVTPGVVPTWYAWNNFVLGSPSRVIGEWKLEIHTVNGNNYSGTFTISENDYNLFPPPIPVQIDNIIKIGSYYYVYFNTTNAASYKLRYLNETGTDIIYDNPTKIHDTGTRYYFIVPDYPGIEQLSARIEARGTPANNPFPGLKGTNASNCAFSPGQWQSKASTYFKIHQ